MCEEGFTHDYISTFIFTGGPVKSGGTIKPKTTVQDGVFTICMGETTGYFQQEAMIFSSCVCADKTRYFEPKHGVFLNTVLSKLKSIHFTLRKRKIATSGLQKCIWPIFIVAMRLERSCSRVRWM